MADTTFHKIWDNNKVFEITSAIEIPLQKKFDFQLRRLGVFQYLIFNIRKILH